MDSDEDGNSDDSYEQEEFSSFRRQRLNNSNSKEDAIYGVFAHDDDEFEPTKTRNIKRRDTSQPVAFVQSKTAEELKGNDDEEDDEGEEALDSKSNFQNIMKTVADEGLSNETFKKLASGQPPPSTSESKSNMSEVDLRQLGAWEKHTKGIGMKLLQKFGFKGRLGLRESGISKPIEAVVRPNLEGLGFSKTVKTVEGAIKEVGTKRQRNIAEVGSSDLESANSWKKGKARKSQASKTVSELMRRQDQDTVKTQVIIDMRHKQTKILTNLADSGTVSAGEDDEGLLTQKKQLGAEFVYNMSLVADLVSLEVNKESREMNRIIAQAEAARAECDALEKQLSKDQPRQENLQKILQILQRMEEKRAELVLGLSERGITPATICTLFITLHDNFPEEFQLFGLLHLFPSIAEPAMSSLVVAWSPLEAPAVLLDMYYNWQPLVDHFKAVGKSGLASCVRGYVEDAIASVLLPLVRRSVMTDWDVRDPQACVSLFEALDAMIDPALFDQTINMTVMPKIKAQVREWNPGADPIPVHTWLHPWLPLLGSRLSEVYPEIRRKMGQMLTYWKPSQRYAVEMLAPWREVFDATSMDNLLIRSVLPKLVAALQQLVINPAGQDLKEVEWVLAWQDVLPVTHSVALWSGEFAEKFLKCLAVWLASPNAALKEIVDWYVGWKGLFSLTLLKRDEMMKVFGKALFLMSRAMDGRCGAQGTQGSAAAASVGTRDSIPLSSADELLGFIGMDMGHQGRGYFDIMEQQKREKKMQSRLDELSKPDVTARNLTGDSKHEFIHPAFNSIGDKQPKYVPSFLMFCCCIFLRRGRWCELQRSGGSLCNPARDIVFSQAWK